METPFDRPPINVSATLVDGSIPAWRKDYLATVVATTEGKGRLLESLRTGEDPTIRDGVNLALNRLFDLEAPKDGLGKTGSSSMTEPERASPFRRSWPRKRLRTRRESPR
jgi:hypothetical protein